MAAFEIEKTDDGFELYDDFANDTKIMVFGVGGGGGNTVSHMIRKQVKDVVYIVANTDVNALRSIDGKESMTRIQIGKKKTRGQGAGSDPAIGKESAEEQLDVIDESLNGVSMVFIAAGMGGGTGTGAAPVIAKAAKDKGILTVGVVTKPFSFEGSARMECAMEGISEMRKYVDSLIIIPNDRVREISGSKFTMADAYAAVDDVLCKSVVGIISVVSKQSTINIDFADVCTTLRNSGIAHMALGEGEGDNKLEDALAQVMSSPLLETSIQGAKRGMVNVCVSRDMPFEEFDSMMNKIETQFNAGAKYKVGVTYSEDSNPDKVSLIVVATDFDDNALYGTANPAPRANPVTAPAPAPAAAGRPAPAPVTVSRPEPAYPTPKSDAEVSDDINSLLNLFNRGDDQ